MLQLKEGARPGLGGDGRADRHGGVGTPPSGDYRNTNSGSGQGGPKAVAIEVFKRGRWLVVAKCTQLQGVRVLAVAHDRQHGVDSIISVPEAALRFAEGWGCMALYFWRASTGEVRRLPLDRAFEVGWWGSGAGRERYLPIADMECVGDWVKPRWAYAEKTLRLSADRSHGAKGVHTTPQPPEGRQLPLDLGAAP